MQVWLESLALHVNSVASSLAQEVTAQNRSSVPRATDQVARKAGHARVVAVRFVMTLCVAFVVMVLEAPLAPRDAPAMSRTTLSDSRRARNLAWAGAATVRR